jgi:Mg-chelatase subunit ChlD
VQIAGKLNKTKERQVHALIAHQLEQITRIHSRDVKRLDVQESGATMPPGWSIGDQISLNVDALPDWRTVDGLAVWLGVAMHELGHCTWSPPKSNFPSELHQVYNLAEDQRQEALVAEDLPGVIGSFTQAVAQLILANPQMHASRIWPLVAGRLYLPADLLAAVRAGAVAEKGAEWAAGVYDSIANYKALVDPGFADLDAANVELTELKRLLGELADMGGPPPEICNANGRQDPEIGGVEGEPDPNDPEGEGTSGEADGEGEAGKGEGEGADGEGEGEGEGSSNGEPPDADDNPNPGQGIGKGHVHGLKAPTAESLADAVRAAAKLARENIDQRLREQARAVLARIRGEDVGVAPIDRGGSLKRAPSPEARMAQKRLLRSLKPLLVASEAGLDRMTSSGRIRPDRLENGYRPDHVFDKWRLDQADQVSAEIVLAVDVSGSMSSEMTHLAEAIWVMRQVVAKTSSRLRVLLWDTQVTEYRAPLTGQVEVLSARGGTNPKPAIATAQAIFDGSHAKRKWLIVMTDGQVSAQDGIRERCDALVASGVSMTVLEFGYSADASEFTANPEARKKIKDLSEMPEILGQMLRRVYRKNIT